MAELPAIHEEDTELQQELHKVVAYPKLAKWFQLFLDKSNPKTFGNRTQSALEAYSLDPVTQYFSAAKIGNENYKKVKSLGALYYERDGMTPGKVLDLIAVHAVEKGGIALKMLAEITEVYNPKPLIAFQKNVQINTAPTNSTVEEIDKSRKDFKEFLDAKYKNSQTVDASTT